MKYLIEKYIENKRVLIAGFGKEGRSTLGYLTTHFPNLKPAVADQNSNLKLSVEEKSGISAFFLGIDYLEAIPDFDVIIKSPGIDFKEKIDTLKTKTILSQTSLFLERFHWQIIGITGSKGKSTTSSLIYHILRSAGKDTMLVGNIGQPPLDFCDQVSQDTIIVFEISAHQLEYVTCSPHIAVLLNIFQEHLDYFKTFENYASAKRNILKFQHEDDFYLLPDNNHIPDIEGVKAITPGKQIILSIFEEEADFCLKNQQFVLEKGRNQTTDISEHQLKGSHNMRNILTAVAACRLAGVDGSEISKAVATFQPLEHRLEYAGNFGGIDFYNDSISTIPEATIEAVNTVKHAETLILGGFDRGIDYDKLIDFLSHSQIRNFIFTGPAGKRMMNLFESKKQQDQKFFFIHSFSELAGIIKSVTSQGKACLLSPAASSYDEFKNFEERGAIYKKIARNL